MTTIETPSAVYEAGRREWNERYGSYISRARHWRRAALAMAGTTAISTCCVAWMATQAHVVPYVVEVNKLGESIAVHRLTVAPPVDAGRIRAQLGRWVTDVRSVYTDPSAETSNVTEALAWVDRQSDALQQITAAFQVAPPNDRALKETVGVEIESAGQIGPDTWSVDWNEETYTRDGGAPTKSYWRMTARIKVSPPEDDATIMVNPGGVYIIWFKVSPRLGR
jgi:type IV secretion system protein VirB5